MAKFIFSTFILSGLIVLSANAAPNWIQSGLYFKKDGACLNDYDYVSIDPEVGGGYKVWFMGEGSCQNPNERIIHIPKPNQGEILVSSQRVNDVNTTKVVERSVLNDKELMMARRAGLYSGEKLKRVLMDWNASIRVSPQGQDAAEIVVEIPAEGIVCTFKR